MTLRQRVLDAMDLLRTGGITATALCQFLNIDATKGPKHSPACVRWDGQLYTCDRSCPIANPELRPRRIKLATLSSLLKKMYDEGVLDRWEGCGPRGGYGYRMKENT